MKAMGVLAMAWKTAGSAWQVLGITHIAFCEACSISVETNVIVRPERRCNSPIVAGTTPNVLWATFAAGSGGDGPRDRYQSWHRGQARSPVGHTAEGVAVADVMASFGMNCSGKIFDSCA